LKKLAVIIPVYGEENKIESLLSHLAKTFFQHWNSVEIIVVDGDPEGTTISKIKNSEIKIIKSKKGRANQMNRGAEESKATNLLFLHADTLLPENSFEIIEKTLQQKKLAAGAFSIRIDSTHPFLRFVSAMTNLRSKVTRTPYGDQAIFIKSSAFMEIGGFPNLPIMEDVQLMVNLKKAKRKIEIVDETVVTSARRWEKEGMLYCTLRNRVLSVLFSLGFPADRLSSFYRTNKK